MTRSRLAFAVNQGKLKSASDVLVLAPRLNSPVDPNTYVTVVGEVVRFDPDEIARKTKDYAVDLPPDMASSAAAEAAALPELPAVPEPAPAPAGRGRLAKPKITPGE